MIFLQIHAEAGLRRPVLAGAGWYWMLRPASAWICKKIINALSSGYQDLMGYLILTNRSEICSDLNYTNTHGGQNMQHMCMFKSSNENSWNLLCNGDHFWPPDGNRGQKPGGWGEGGAKISPPLFHDWRIRIRVKIFSATSASNGS